MRAELQYLLFLLLMTPYIHTYTYVEYIQHILYIKYIKYTHIHEYTYQLIIKLFSPSIFIYRGMNPIKPLG